LIGTCLIGEGRGLRQGAFRLSKLMFRQG